MSEVSGRPKNLEEVKDSLKKRLIGYGNPMRHCDPTEAKAAIERLQSLDGEHWGSVWGAVGALYAEKAAQAEAAGDAETAAAAHHQAYAFYYVGRFPCPNHPQKMECARRAREHFLAAARSLDPPLEKIVIPFDGRAGEGKEVIGYLRKPKGIDRPPVLVNWGGIDGFKEERHENSKASLAAGMAILAIDMPGTGESPVWGSLDAERQFTPVFELVRKRTDLDGSRIAILGSSFGGYWVTKVAHTHRDYLKAAVNWGGGVHFNFQPDWTLKSRYADSYLMDLAETRAYTCNFSSYEEFVAFAPKLSLLDQGILDQPCAPLLLINGKEDKQVPIEDHYLLLEHGNPKSMRVFPGGHMGRTPATLPTIITWIAERLGV